MASLEPRPHLLRGGDFFIEDAGSDTGTFVNGEKLASRQALAAGDLIRLGPTIELVYGNHG